MQPLLALIRRAPLLTAAVLLLVAKSIQFAIDSQAIFEFDSGAFILNAIGRAFIPYRSYVYGFLLHVFAVPFHSLRAIVAMQMIMGGITAWLLTFALVRFFQVRAWIAILAGLAFAFDPVQIVFDHLVMTENATLFAIALFLVAALQYLRDSRLLWLALVSFFGILMVSLRIAYLPVVLAGAVLLPVVAYLSSRPRRPRVLALALLVSCCSAMIFHLGYRYLTGRLARREPAYHYMTGAFLLAIVTPMIEREDASDVRVAEAMVVQQKSSLPLSNRGIRVDQLWDADGFVARLRNTFGGDERATDRAAEHIARAAIQRDPIGFIKLGLLNYRSYWTGLRYLRTGFAWDGSGPKPTIVPGDVGVISSVFGVDVSNQHTWRTPSRRYHILGRYWYVFLLASPFLLGLAMWLSPAHRTNLAVLFSWTCLVFAAICFGGHAIALRFLHPFSFTGLAAAAVLSETIARRWISRRLG